MPVHKCPNGKYRIGKGKCMYTSRSSAEKAYQAYRASTQNESVKDLKAWIDIIESRKSGS